MTFALSQRSLSRLEGVDKRLVEVVKLAITYTDVDFGITEGLRSPQRQLELYHKGASQIAVGGTHVSGRAVDTVAYVAGEVSWQITMYDNIADAFKRAAIEVGVPVRWGAAWHINDIRKWQGTMQEATNQYVDLRRSQGQRPFIDGPHFEIPDGY